MVGCLESEEQNVVYDAKNNPLAHATKQQVELQSGWAAFLRT